LGDKVGFIQLKPGGRPGGRPGDDQDGFDPATIIAEASAHGEHAAFGPAFATLGVWGGLRDAALSPLRQLSFWKMKDRARRFGESGGHDLLSRLQRTAPTARFHLMGHSFGCITVSSAVGGAVDAPPLPRPIDSLFLVQGALSLWSFAAEIPYAKGKAGYFNRIIADRRVSGPIITTRSAYDTAIGRYYPLGPTLRNNSCWTRDFLRTAGSARSASAVFRSRLICRSSRWGFSTTSAVRVSTT
jgi:hypothetical protein